MVIRPCALRVGGDEFIAPDMAYPVGVGLLHYHLLLCFDGISGDLLKAQLRDGTHYCSKDADQFMIPLLQEYRTKYPSLPLYLRGDSGFASPYLCQASEDNDCKYAIRLKINKTLLALAKDKADDLRRIKSSVLLRTWKNGKLHQGRQGRFCFFRCQRQTKNRQCQPVSVACACL